MFNEKGLKRMWAEGKPKWTGSPFIREDRVYYTGLPKEPLPSIKLKVLFDELEEARRTIAKLRETNHRQRREFSKHLNTPYGKTLAEERLETIVNQKDHIKRQDSQLDHMRKTILRIRAREETVATKLADAENRLFEVASKWEIAENRLSGVKAKWEDAEIKLYNMRRLFKEKLFWIVS